MNSFAVAPAQQLDSRPGLPRGMRLLHERRPGWEKKIDLARLDMAWHETCLLCQVFGTYEAGIRRLGIGPSLLDTDFGGWMNWDAYGGAYGFTVPPEIPGEERQQAFVRLTEDWKEAIAELRQRKARRQKKAVLINRLLALEGEVSYLFTEDHQNERAGAAYTVCHLSVGPSGEYRATVINPRGADNKQFLVGPWAKLLFFLDDEDPLVPLLGPEDEEGFNGSDE